MTDIVQLLGKEADTLLQHRCMTIPAESLYLPGADYVDRVMIDNNRSPAVLRNMQTLYNTGRLAGTGYLSILPVDQGVEHSAGASFAANPLYFDPKNIVELAIESGCNCVASTYGVLASVSRRYAHRIPFMVKLNHNETLSYPTQYDQTLYASVDQAFNLGAVAVGATIYFGSEQSRRQLEEISVAFERAHELGMVTVLWAYLRNNDFKKEGVDYHASADLTGQANHLAATIGADIVKQKMAENNGGYNAVKFGSTDERVYSKLTSDNPIDLVRYQLANCYMGRAGLINSGGAAAGETDTAESVRTAVINKRAGGMRLILGRKAFKKSMKDGVALINSVQDVYLAKDVTIA
ncbi:class I fructose-bisphosphate aldolase [Erwinia billingiae]|uniref:class I fructose-bisphosphate aldolase n=1 Tax=Erwinia billingiae TaxID=182337 RepID=UPI00069D52C0|nr:class I fructose-bisphosphate aldolase [Erwinia billingiae]